MNSIQISIPDTARYCLPSMTIECTVNWHCQQEPHNLHIKLIYYTEGKGSQDVIVVDDHTWKSPGRSGSKSDSFNLPDQPYSFSGKYISLIWAVEALIEPGSECARQQFVMSPSGQEIILHADAK